MMLIAPAGLGEDINAAFFDGFLQADTEAGLTPWLNMLASDPAALSSALARTTLRQRQERPLVAEQRRLDPMIDQALASGWPLKRVETILRAVLRAGAYELDRKPDIPARVIVSEYVDIANAFVDRDETGMINAVLDQIARQLRAAEFDRTAG